MLEFYTAVVLTGILVFYYGSANGAREYLSVLCSAALSFAVCAGCGGDSISVPALPMCVTLFAGWIALSVLWAGNKEQAIKGAIVLLSAFALFWAAQQVSAEWVLFWSFAPAPGVAATMLFEKQKRAGGIFGNCNHAGVYLALNVLTGVWLAQNVTLWLSPFVVLCAVGIVRSGCRNAIISTGIGIASLAAFLSGSLSVALILVSAVVGAALVSGFLIVGEKGGRWFRWSHRDVIFKNVLKLIAKKPLFGWGINQYRFENWRVQPVFSTHRAHNDYFEFAFELGIIGIILFFGIYAAVDWFREPILSAQLVIGLVTMLGFFSFREIHTVMPIMAVLAVLIPASGALWTISGPACVLLMIAIPYLLWLYVGKGIVGLYWWATGSRQKTREEALGCVLKALKYDPNGKYLTRAIYLSAKDHAEWAWDMTCRMVFQYDGYLVLWGVYDQAARMAYRMGALDIAAEWNRKSLEIRPEGNKSAEDFRAVIAAAYQKMTGGRNAEVSVH